MSLRGKAYQADNAFEDYFDSRDCFVVSLLAKTAVRHLPTVTERLLRKKDSLDCWQGVYYLLIRKQEACVNQGS
ncbi:MAG TPA: hypothetical protein VK463_00045 [Desulfomonilaceae bacterium]|nr:hypothetical protein [Desulfomonilaceae bacterium]